MTPTDAERTAEESLTDRIARTEILPRIDADLVAEHRENPFGPHSDDLQHVVVFLGRRPIRGAHVVAMERPHEEWAIARVPEERGGSFELTGQRFESQREAVHAVFLRRLEAFLERYGDGDLPDGTDGFPDDRDDGGDRPAGGSEGQRERTFGRKRITAYCDRWSVRPGESLGFKVNCETESYRADVVRLICGDVNPDGPGYEEEHVETDANGVYPGREQSLRTGSHVRVEDDALALGTFTVGAFVSPTTPGKADQGIATRWASANDSDGTATGAVSGEGYGLFLDEGEFVLRVGGAAVRDGPVEADRWYAVAGSYDPETDRVRLDWRALPGADRIVPVPDADLEGSVETGVGTDPTTDADLPFVIAGHDDPVEGHYNGRLEAPRVADRALADPLAVLEDDPRDAVAAWDFAAGIDDDGVAAPDLATDVGPNGLDGTVVNVPSRGIPGHDWSRDVHDFTAAPGEFGAIHFHDDDLADAGWDVDFELAAGDLPSGVYAARLRTDAWDGSGYDPANEYYVPFYVLPPAGESTADVLFLAPTNSYLAYANNTMKVEGEVGGMNREPVFESGHAFLAEHREYGLSMYDTHADGSGSMFSSRHRPLITVAPKYVRGGAPPSHLHQFNADLYLIDWLETQGYEYDVATDADLQRDPSLLERYNVVLTGHHPEYYSRRQFEAVESYQQSGGRLMYLGGNGFYWVIAYHPQRPGIIEVRRGENGSESWVPRPGEKYHGFTGEKGGLWRERGWAPNRLVGVGTSGMWEPVCTGYRRQPDSYDPAVAFVFDGVDGETFGDFGLLGGGAAGQEIDRYDTGWGTPEHAFLLAASEGHTEHERRVVEELPGNEPFTSARMDPKVRADVVYYRTPGDGAVFSTGSMAWIGSLAHDDYDNDVSRITANVLEAFSADGSLPDDDG